MCNKYRLKQLCVMFIDVFVKYIYNYLKLLHLRKYFSFKGRITDMSKEWEVISGPENYKGKHFSHSPLKTILQIIIISVFCIML